MKKYNKLVAFMGTVMVVVATVVASPASWVLLHSEELPEELK